VQCVADPRFARIVVAAAAPSVAEPDTDADADVAIESLRALGSLAPLFAASSDAAAQLAARVAARPGGREVH
jgi:hypothetical protein